MLAPCANCSKIFPAATFSLRSGGKVKESSKLKASKSSLNSSAAPLSLSPPALGVVYTSRAAEPSSLPTGELLEHQGALASPGLRLASPFLLSKRPDQPTTWPRRVRAHAPWAPAGVGHPTWPTKTSRPRGPHPTLRPSLPSRSMVRIECLGCFSTLW